MIVVALFLGLVASTIDALESGGAPALVLLFAATFAVSVGLAVAVARTHARTLAGLILSGAHPELYPSDSITVARAIATLSTVSPSGQVPIAEDADVSMPDPSEATPALEEAGYLTGTPDRQIAKEIQEDPAFWGATPEDAAEQPPFWDAYAADPASPDEPALGESIMNHEAAAKPTDLSSQSAAIEAKGSDEIQTSSPTGPLPSDQAPEPPHRDLDEILAELRKIAQPDEA